MRLTILTLFPDVFEPLVKTSILKKAQKKDLLTIRLINIRDFGEGNYKKVDDKTYGGGVGMLLKVDILYNAITSAKFKAPAKGPLRSGASEARQGRQNSKLKERIILLDPKGKTFNQQKAKQLAKFDHLILVCGHYEGVDARIEKYVDEIISIGDFVLTGGEIPAMAITDAVIRLIPGVLPKDATKTESFEQGLLEYPQYTRPEKFKGEKVPDILLSGNHKEIEKWRKSKQKSA